MVLFCRQAHACLENYIRKKKENSKSTVLWLAKQLHLFALEERRNLKTFFSATFIKVGLIDLFC